MDRTLFLEERQSMSGLQMLPPPPPNQGAEKLVLHEREPDVWNFRMKDFGFITL